MPKAEGEIAPVEPQRENDPIAMTTKKQVPEIPTKNTEVTEIAKRERKVERRPKKIETKARKSVYRTPLPPSLPTALPPNKVAR